MEDALTHINSHSLLLARLPSVIFGAFFLAAFYYILKGWFGRPIAYLGSILLATTPLFLILAHNGTPRIMYFTPVLFLAAHRVLSRAKQRPKLAAAALVIALAFCLYVPGVIWLLIGGMIMKWRLVYKLLRNNRNTDVALMALMLLVLIAPLMYALVIHPHLGKTLLLIPDHFPGWLQTLKDWGWMIIALFARSRTHQDVVLGQLPLLDAAQIGLGIFGGYVMWSRLRTQFLWLIGLVLLSCLGAALNSNYSLLALGLPLLSILVGMGLRYLYIEWMHIFPRNPFPRYFAILLMAAVVFTHVIYGVRYSLIAWPRTVAVQSLRVLK
ncbi:MAG: conserved rane protein of unknown function [Candidatus Saccharibacteria bacterium]|nr:conserved rane protein of unknown function [Candidatus Saccharibacteria bacterium]